MLMQTGAPGAVVSLKSYSKDIPPGWRPRAYPIKEYEQNLKIWAHLTTLDQSKWGAAIMSRLDGQALKIAQDMPITRYDTNIEANRTVYGLEAISLPERAAGVSPNGTEYPYQDSGIKIFIQNLKTMYHLDDQDQAWTSIDRFFSFKMLPHMDFQTYVFEWHHLIGEAEKLGGLTLSEPAKCWLFWSRTNLSDKALADLRLQVKGDLTRWREMVNLHMRICKNEFASQEQARDYKHTYSTDDLGNQAV